nr:unnamed protein product [Spirometra erinaceieuropaei]
MGTRRHRGSAGMIFSVRQLQEKCQKRQIYLYSTLVNPTTVNREGLWKIMQKFDGPERFIQMARQLHEGITARVTGNAAVLEAFAITNGVKQGCVLGLILTVMLINAYCESCTGIRVAYRTDGQLHSQRRMQFQSHVLTTSVHELLFADDCSLNATS